MNTSLMHADTMESIRPRSNDERRAHWATKYFALGFHRRPEKPRVRVTVPAPLSPEPAKVGEEPNAHEQGSRRESHAGGCVHRRNPHEL